MDGLAGFLTAEGVTHLLDATHPYAVGMSRNAALAARRALLPHAVFLRPAWERVDGISGGRWILRAARDARSRGRPALPGARSQHVAPFRHRPDLSPVLRQVDAPAEPLPFAARLVLGRPGTDPAEEAARFQAERITHLVCRNSGGGRGYAKIAAARALGLPVILIPPPARAGRADPAPPRRRHGVVSRLIEIPY